MPIYEYKCKECGKTFDVLQKLNSDPVKSCIHCGGNVDKMISAPSFQFKGSGWYVTDYKNKEKNNNNKPKSVSGSTGDGKEKKSKGKVKEKNVA